MNNFNFKIFPEKFLIIKHYQGIFNIDDLYRFTKETSMSLDYNPNYFVLNDMRSCELVTNDEDIHNFVEKIRNDNKLYAKRNIVFLTSTPGHVIFSELINQFKNEGFIKLLTCSTLEKALIHLNISASDKTFIENILYEFKNV